MRRQRYIEIFLYAMLLFSINSSIALAKYEIAVISDKDNIQIGEEVGFKINLEDVNIASYTLTIYFDESKLQYISGPKNSNNINGRVLYTWVSDTGENKSNIDTDTFLFKGKADGIANIVVIGEFYNAEGNKIELENASKQIHIGNINDEIKEQQQIDESNVQPNDTNLKTLRIDQEGINPNFDPNIKEYYFIASKEIDKLEVTAISKNKKALVTITGNDNLKMGENVISINIESEDKSKVDVYKIYVTRTENIEMANANLENLAIRQATLNPEFDSNITQYKAEIANDINKIDILAIPQKQNAKVNIVGNNEMKIGLNKIEITVIAENGITDKKYILEVYRRNEEEEVKIQEEYRIEAEKLATILEEVQDNNEKSNLEENSNQDKIESQKEITQSKTNVGILLIVISIVIIISFYFLRKRKK